LASPSLTSLIAFSSSRSATALVNSPAIIFLPPAYLDSLLRILSQKQKKGQQAASISGFQGSEIVGFDGARMIGGGRSFCQHTPLS
jgi:hypothetical protein